MNEAKIIEEKFLDNNKAIIQTVERNKMKVKKIVLPTLSYFDLLDRYEHIKPIVMFDNLHYYLRDFNEKELRTYPYLDHIFNDLRKRAFMDDVKVLCEFKCYHIMTRYGIFKPTINEVLSQMPDEVVKKANAFYMSRRYEDIPFEERNKELHNMRCYESTIQALVLKK